MPHRYSDWSLDKLKKERQKIEKAIKMAEKRDKKSTLAKMAALAKQNGFELHELISEISSESGTRALPKSGPKTTKTRAKVAPKYRNPHDESQLWTGRGRQPLWVKELIASGAELADLEITKVV